MQTNKQTIDATDEWWDEKIKVSSITLYNSIDTIFIINR